jgi:Domain of unknown function (DUF4296)
VKRKFYSKRVKENKFFPLLLIPAFTLLVCCGGKKIGTETLVRTYVDNLIAQETYSYNPDSLNTHRKKIFEKYSISQTDFENSLKNYREDQDKWTLFFKRSNDILDSLKRTGKIN